MKKTNKIFEPLDKEERDLMESIDRGEWQPVSNIEEEKEKAMTAARNTLKKDKRINLRLTQKDYYQIQIRAIEEGIPYQTLISSLVHKYLNGTLAPVSQIIEEPEHGQLIRYTFNKQTSEEMLKMMQGNE